MSTIVVGPLLAVAVALVLCGCNGKGSGGPFGASGGRSAAGTASVVTMDEIRTIAENFADSYVIASVQPLDELIASTKRPEVAEWALQQKVATATAAYTIATEPNPIVACIDLVILASLKSRAVEQHWVPNLLRDEGAGVLAAAKRAERDAWTATSRALTPAQLNDLRQVIDAWVAEHPGQYYVGWVKLTDIASAKSLNAHSPQVKLPGSLFGLLFIDPLAGLDPVTQEMHSYRMLTERLTYLFMRMPMVYSWQAQATFDAMMGGEAPREFISATSKFADATDRFADATKDYPKEFGQIAQQSIGRLDEIVARERSAAIEQVGDQVTSQREGLMKDLDEREAKVRQLIGDARAAVGDVERSIVTAKSVASDTIRQTDDASGRLVARVRNAVIVVILVACVMPAVVMLAYRRLAPRSQKDQA